jgi:hypothetical protein
MTIWDVLAGKPSAYPASNAPYLQLTIHAPVYEAERVYRMGVALQVNDGRDVTLVVEYDD